MIRWVAILVLSLSSVAGANLNIPAGLLPGGVWWSSNSVGVVGGIPNVTTIYTNLSPTGNTLRDWTNIQTALLLCPSNQVVYLNEGTFGVPDRGLGWGVAGSGGWMQIQGNNGVVLRGAGMRKTFLNLDSGASLSIAGYLSGHSPPFTNQMYRWISGYAQSATNITVGTNWGGVLPTLGVGDVIVLTQENDPSLVNINGNEPGITGPAIIFTDALSNNCNQLQLVRVTSVSSGTNLTIWPGVYMTNYQASLRPQVVFLGTPVGFRCGLEEMTVNNNIANLSGGTLSVNDGYDCWAKNIEFNLPGYAAVFFAWSAHCTMEGCYAHDSASGGAATSYGGYAGRSSDCLFENNIFAQITSPILIEYGVSGIVAGYNLATNGIYGVGPQFMPTAFQTHGAHPTMNLFEGNVSTLAAHDAVHGSGSHNMNFRNYYSGWQDGKIYNTFAVTVMTSNRFTSFVGNVLGKDGYHTNYEETALNYPTNYGNVNTIYLLGFWGGNWTNFNADSLTVTTLWREGNYDYATHSTIWDGNGAVTLPSSLYLTSKPDWWGSSSWPSIGSDMSPMVGTIPAELRFNSLLQPTANITTLNVGTVNFR